MVNLEAANKYICFLIILITSFVLLSRCLANEREVADKLSFDNLLPLVIKNNNSLELSRNAISSKHKQEWFSIIDKSIKSIDDKDYAISIIRYLDSEYALDEFNSLFSTGFITASKNKDRSIDFCGYYVSHLKGMTERTVFILIGIDGNYFMMLGKLSLMRKAFDLNSYCEIRL